MILPPGKRTSDDDNDNRHGRSKSKTEEEQEQESSQPPAFNAVVLERKLKAVFAKTNEVG